MLGWGEITLTRYISAGYTPNKINSDRLRALNDPYEVQNIIYKKLQPMELKSEHTSFQQQLQRKKQEKKHSGQLILYPGTKLLTR